MPAISLRRGRTASVCSASAYPVTMAEGAAASRFVREGGTEKRKLIRQANKPTPDQEKIVDRLPRLNNGDSVDVAVVVRAQ